ncbi:unnamed protein product [Adineta steineri]|uniref:Uncharacterized protein n=1 Tax=Adineta steineri TaxID=433720 RepID=A0A815X266_9BILA|nr:unnamed protein product [Adineta steineri]CAF1551393.1 unnamed protein product [Adineta steineri]
MSRFIGEQVRRVKQTIEKLHIQPSDDSPENTLTRDYGFLKFNEQEIDSTTRLSQYIRLALNTDPGTVIQFMKKAWNLRTPDLIISITGGAKHCELAARLKKNFQIGLVSAAATTNAWIITAGTNAGVVQEVGEALNNYRYKNQKDGVDIPCIGIGSWGYTARNELLDHASGLMDGNNKTDIDEPYSPSKKVHFNFGIDALQMVGESVYGIKTYIVPQKQEKRCELESNHTHFLLFDDGLVKPENVLPLRADIEVNLRRLNIEQTIEGAVHTLIPIVMVLVEGGRSSIKTVCEALDANTPVVVVKGSGRAADLVAELHICYSKIFNDSNVDNDNDNDHKSTHQTGFVAASLRLTEINSIFAKAKLHNTWIDTIRDDLCRMLSERSQLVTIFDFDNETQHGKLEDAILEAVFNAAKYYHQTNDQHRSAAELKLASAWHNVEYARRAIFTDLNISKWSNEDLRQGLVDALSRGYIDFIELFIEYGITLEKLTIKDLDYLYSTAYIDKVLPLKKIKYTVPTRDDFYAVYMRNYIEVYNDKNVPLGDHALRDLFFWAIFLDRFDLALYLCSKTWNQSVAPLFGARIYAKAAAMTLDSETKQLYKHNAEKLDKYAASLVDRCFECDRDFAVNILKRPAIAFFNVLPLKLALKANCRAFLASKCVQRYLDNEWFGNINYKRQNINFRIFLCSVFFPLIPFFCHTLPYIHRHQPYNPNAVVRSRNPNSSTHPRTASNVRWTEKIVYFYKAPIVRFYYNLIFFFVFLGLFSFVLLVDYFPLNVYNGTRSGIRGLPLPITEICLHVCIWGIIIEELRQFFLMHSYDEYLDEISNIIDMTAIILYIIGFITRFVVIEGFFTFSKIIFGLDLILWYIRILHLFAAYERLGPKLIMIFNTMKDLLFFVCFILIFLFGFSITSWSLIITSSQVQWIYDKRGDLLNVTVSENGTHGWNWKLLRDVTNYGVWKVFGQVDEIESDNSYSAVAFILAILFVAISNVLLLNVLVALFNVTIENVQDQSHDIWRYQRFLLVNEFRQKSLLPPPFNTLYCLINAIVRFIAHRQKRYRNHRLIPDEKLTVDIIETGDGLTVPRLKITDSMKRENAIVEDFWRDLLKQMEEKKTN